MPGRITRVFIDSNVWFSAFYGSANCQKLTQSHQKGKIIAVVSTLVVDEIVKNVRKKLPDHFAKLQKFLLASPPEIVTNPKKIPDPLINLVSIGDLPIFVSAVLAKVNYFVTGNIKHFHKEKLEKLTGIKILTPNEAVEILDL